MVTSGSGPAGRRSARTAARPIVDLADRAVATYLAMESCREMADEETAAGLGAAMAWLDNIARFGHLLAGDDQRGFLTDLREIDEMVSAIRQHLQEGRERD
jgi:hypothetical protein